MNDVEKTYGGIKYRIPYPYYEAIVVGTTRSQTELEILSTVDNIPVRKIEDEVFKYNFELRKIRIPDSLHRIGAMAFACCNNLTKIEFFSVPNLRRPGWSFDGTEIARNAFYGCRNLETISCESYTTLNLYQHAFSGCEALKTVQCAFHMLQGHALKDCSELESITFENEGNWVANSFDGCKNLKHVTFLGNVHSSMSQSAINKLKDKRIKCSENSNLLEFAYMGLDIEIL